MSNAERSLRLSLLCAWAGAGYWMGGTTGAFAMLLLFAIVYWVWVIISDGYNKLKKDFGNDGPKIQIDQKVLNMNVEPGAIKGMPYDEAVISHRDPTRP